MTSCPVHFRFLLHSNIFLSLSNILIFCLTFARLTTANRPSISVKSTLLFSRADKFLLISSSILSDSWAMSNWRNVTFGWLWIFLAWWIMSWDTSRPINCLNPENNYSFRSKNNWQYNTFIIYKCISNISFCKSRRFSLLITEVLSHWRINIDEVICIGAFSHQKTVIRMQYLVTI